MSAPFRTGLHKIYLPDAIYTLVRGAGTLPPKQAMFHVPLNTNKFDVRDYLYHLYNVNVTNVRTMIQQGEIVRGTKYQRSKGLHRQKALPWHRLGSTKKVIVMMDEPFIYPEGPKTEDDKAPWDAKTKRIMRERQVKRSRTPVLPFAYKGRVQ